MTDRGIPAAVDGLIAAIRASRWAEALQVPGVDALEAMRSPLYLLYQHLTREAAPTGARPAPAGARLLPVVRERVRTYLEGWEARRRSAAATAGHVVFWPREPTHVKVQLPVARALRAGGTAYGFFTSRAGTVRQLRAAGEAVLFAEAGWPDALARARRRAEERAQQLQVDPRLSLPFHPGEGGSDRWVTALRRCLAGHLPGVYAAAENTARLLDAIPDARVLFVGNDLTLEGRTAALFVRSAGVAVATVSSMHGRAEGPLKDYHVVDRFLTYGERSRRSLIEGGLAPERVVVCGAPYLDETPVQTGTTHPVLQARLGLAAGEPWVLVATSGAGDSVSLPHHEAVVGSVMRLSARLPGVRFVVKLHRKDRLELYERIRKEVPDSRVQVVPDNQPGYPTSIFDWLQGSRALLTGASMVAIEAMLMQVPVISIDLRGELGHVDFIREGAVIGAATEAALEQAVRGVVDTPEQYREVQAQARRYLIDYFHLLDGKSAERCARATLEAAASRAWSPVPDDCCPGGTVA